MSRVIPVLAAVVVAGSVLLGAWQGYRYQRLLDEIDGLEVTQRQRLEENKRTIASIAVFRSPARLQELAEQELKLSRSSDTIYVDLRRAIGSLQPDAGSEAGP